MAKRAPHEERAYQEQLHRQRAHDAAAEKANMLSDIRDAEDLPSLTYALAEYLERYT